MPDNTVIEGHWEESKLNGLAEMTNKSQRYIGEWKDDMVHGKGKETISTKEFYAGTY